jgi:1-acyl-sn-glycerol-3-phosphate acyltransferase
LIIKLLTNLKGVIVITVATVNTFVWFTPLITFTVLKLLVPVPAFRTRMTRWIMAMGENWISTNAFVFDLVNGTRYHVTGLDGLSREQWYMLVVNHQTWVDIIALQTVFNRRIPFLKFFVKQQLIWFPVLGVAFWALDMPFMKRYSKDYLQKYPEKKGQDLEMTRQACAKFHATPTSVINFVEGTRFSEAKRRRRESPYRYLLPPRSGGIAVTLASMGDMFDSMLDITLFYPEGIPTFWDAMCGRFHAVEVHIHQKPIDDWIVHGDYLNDRAYRRRFHRWLAALWAGKDEELAALHASRSSDAMKRDAA